MAYVRKTFAVTTTGADGSAGGNARIPVPHGCARLVGYSLDFDATAPATTDTVISDPGHSSLATVTNSVTDVAWKEIREQSVDLAGAAIAGVYANPVVRGDVVVTVAQSNALSAAVTGVLVFEVG